MITPTQYRKEIEAAAAEHGAIDANLVEALCLVESSGKTYAYRYEPAFWTKYMSVDPRWTGANPERVSASYGLMQVMYAVALEMGYGDQFNGEPEHLFVPSVGLRYGCAKLQSLLAWAKGNTFQALCAYNGGKKANTTTPFRNGAYAAKVLQARSDLITARGTV